MKTQVVGHYRKIPTNVGLGNVIKHNCRSDIYDEKGEVLANNTVPEYITHPERAHLNEGDQWNVADILEKRKKRLVEANLDRKPQNNASVAIEGNYSASNAWFMEHQTDPKEWAKYFEDIRTWLINRFDEKNILHWVVHYDEKTPHMHVLFVPLTRNKQIKPTKKEREASPTEKLKSKYIQTIELRYSSSNFLGGKPGLERLQDELYEVAGKARGLERGKRGSKARHTDQYTWAAETAKMRDTLEADRELLDQQVADLNKRAEELAQQEVDLNKRAEALSQQEQIIAQRIQQYIRDSTAIEEKAANLRKKESALAAKNQEHNEKMKELAKQESHIDYHKQFYKRAGEILSGKDPAILYKAQFSFLFTNLGQKGFNEFIIQSRPLVEQIQIQLGKRPPRTQKENSNQTLSPQNDNSR